MAEEEKSKKNPFMLLIIIQSITLVLIIAILTCLLINRPILKNVDTNNLKGPKNESKEVKAAATYQLQPFIVNLQGEGKRYLKVTMDLALDSKETIQEVEDKMASIRDTIIMILTNKSFKDVCNLSGKAKLREEIKKGINNILESGKVIKVYFSEFVIQ